MIKSINAIMKQKIYIFGAVNVLVILTGLIFKLNHLAGAGVLLTAGLVTLVMIFLPLALINNYKAEGNRQNTTLYIMTWITCFVVFSSMLFKIMHWPYAGILLTIALPFPFLVFLPVFIIITSKDKNFNIYNTVFVLILLATNSVFSALLSLNVTRERIYDSFNISMNYRKTESALDQLKINTRESAVNMKIDGILKIVDEYQDLILKQKGISSDQWNSDPRSIFRPDSKGVAGIALVSSDDLPAGVKLQNQLQSLIAEMEATPGYEKLVTEARVIFDLEVPSGNESEWPDWKFVDNNLSWVLIYLDGLEMNLKMIKASGPM